MDVAEVFAPDQVLEVVVRGTVMYLAIYVMLRVLARRELGTTGVTNILVIVLLADAAQNGLAGGYTSIADGVVLVATVIAWAVLLDLLAYRWPAFARLVKPPPVTLVEEGRVNPRHLRRELMTEQELWTQLREHGVRDLTQVRLALIEPDGRISVLTTARSGGEEPGAPEPPPEPRNIP